MKRTHSEFSTDHKDLLDETQESKRQKIMNPYIGDDCIYIIFGFLDLKNIVKCLSLNKKIKNDIETNEIKVKWSFPCLIQLIKNKCALSLHVCKLQETQRFFKLPVTKFHFIGSCIENNHRPLLEWAHSKKWLDKFPAEQLEKNVGEAIKLKSVASIQYLQETGLFKFKDLRIAKKIAFIKLACQTNQISTAIHIVKTMKQAQNNDTQKLVEYGIKNCSFQFTQAVYTHFYENTTNPPMDDFIGKALKSEKIQTLEFFIDIALKIPNFQMSIFAFEECLNLAIRKCSDTLAKRILIVPHDISVNYARRIVELAFKANIAVVPQVKKTLDVLLKDARIFNAMDKEYVCDLLTLYLPALAFQLIKGTILSKFLCLSTLQKFFCKALNNGNKPLVENILKMKTFKISLNEAHFHNPFPKETIQLVLNSQKCHVSDACWIVVFLRSIEHGSIGTCKLLMEKVKPVLSMQECNLAMTGLIGKNWVDCIKLLINDSKTVITLTMIEDSFHTQGQATAKFLLTSFPDTLKNVSLELKNRLFKKACECQWISTIQILFQTLEFDIETIETCLKDACESDRMGTMNCLVERLIYLSDKKVLV